MPRFAFQLRLRDGTFAEYDEAHRHVWPELLEELKAFGVTEYSIFRRDRQLFLYLRVDDFEKLEARLEASEINLRWQSEMERFFEAVPGTRRSP